MPKIKTNKAAAKRFKATAGGIKFRRCQRNHILTKKTTKRKRHLRGNSLLAPCDAAVVAKMLST